MNFVYTVLNIIRTNNFNSKFVHRNIITEKFVFFFKKVQYLSSDVRKNVKSKKVWIRNSSTYFVTDIRYKNEIFSLDKVMRNLHPNSKLPRISYKAELSTTLDGLHRNKLLHSVDGRMVWKGKTKTRPLHHKSTIFHPIRNFSFTKAVLTPGKLAICFSEFTFLFKNVL